MIPRVTCPPLEAPGTGTLALRTSLLEGARELAARERPDWARISDAYRRAGVFEQAVEAARHAVEADPDTIPPRIRLAQRLVDVEQWQEVLELADGVISAQPSHGIAWQLRALALLQLGRARDGLEAALEARSLRPNDVDSTALVARGYLDSGDRLRALEAVRDHLATRPNDAAALQPLLRTIGG